MSVHSTLAEYALANPEQAFGAIGALGAATFHYSRTGRLPIGRLPWGAARDVLQELRDQYFEKPRPRGVPALVVDADVDALETALRDRHFEGAPASYDYAGEDLNLRRPAGTMPHPETGATVPMETHVRGFATTDDRLLCLTHHEASRYEATGEHLRPGLYSWERGRERLRGVLVETDLDATTVPSERESGVEVTP